MVKCPGQDDGELSMCERLIAEMRNVFGDDRKRISHALKVLSFAEEILKHEEGDPLTVRGRQFFMTSAFMKLNANTIPQPETIRSSRDRRLPKR